MSELELAGCQKPPLLLLLLLSLLTLPAIALPELLPLLPAVLCESSEEDCAD
jgi:hypothetical protein